MNAWKNASVAEMDKKRQVERAEEELRITELMYSEGMGAQIDLINAQTAYQGVRTQYLNSVKEMYVALVQLRRAIGDYSPDESGVRPWSATARGAPSAGRSPGRRCGISGTKGPRRPTASWRRSTRMRRRKNQRRKNE